MDIMAAPANRAKTGRFVAGHSGNPSGRPKSRELTNALVQTVHKKELAEKLWAMAKGGDLQAIKYIYDRIDGTPTQRIEHDDEATIRCLADDFDIPPEQVRRDLAEQRKHLKLVKP